MKLLILLALCVPLASAVTIHGTTYDFDLSKISNALIEINSSPAQRLVATQGAYTFNVPPGIYRLRATSKDLLIEEEVRALDEGTYVLDLILLPSLEQADALLAEDIEIPNVDFVIESKPPLHWIAWLAALLAIGALIAWFSRKKHKTLPPDLEEVLQFINKEGGRANQKDIFRNSNYSEAKISLIIDDLESRGLVKRIKKG